MFSILSFFWPLFTVKDRCANPQPFPSIPAAESGPPPDEVRGDAVSATALKADDSHDANSRNNSRGGCFLYSGPRLSHDVPTLPVDITFAPIQVAALAEPFPHPNAESQLFTV